MKGDILRGMLLIEEPSVLKLHHEMMSIAGYFVAPVFMIAVILEFFGEMNFGEVVKKLLIVTVFMSLFYQVHQGATSLALSSASETLQKVSPRNIFVKKWHEVKLRTKEKKEWSLIEKFAIPNLNDLVATAFFLLAKVFLVLLKLIYSTVYHFTYVFSGITAVLYFLGWTKNSLKGTIQGSLWCMLMPYVLVGILALVGNSFEETSSHGELVLAKVDTILWLFGVTLLMLISPLITYGMVNGEGVQSFGAKMGQMVTSAGLRGVSMLPAAVIVGQRMKSGAQSLTEKGQKLKDSMKGLGVSKPSATKGTGNSTHSSSTQMTNSNQSERVNEGGNNTERNSKTNSASQNAQSNRKDHSTADRHSKNVSTNDSKGELKAGNVPNNPISNKKPYESAKYPEVLKNKSQNQSRILSTNSSRETKSISTPSIQRSPGRMNEVRKV